MRAIGLIILASALLSSALDASAGDEFNGSKLYEYCGEHNSSAAQLGCTAFIHGLLDGLLLGRFGLYCPPKDGVDVAQGRLIIEKFMRDHPEILNDQAGYVAAVAMSVTFPCKKSN
jgi:hypothetical protein